MQQVQISDVVVPPVEIVAPPKNKLLAAITSDDYQRLAPHLRAVSVTARQTLLGQGEPIRDVYFPGGGAWALVKTVTDGQMAQIAAVGKEGVIGASVFFGETIARWDTLVQLPQDGALAMTVEMFNAEMGRRGAFYNRVVRYFQTLMAQVEQATVCNGLHSAAQRCCRWLLTTRDCVKANEFPLTHEFLSMMLGVRRPTVTLIVGNLEKTGIVSHQRGVIRIVDEHALEAASCECYATVKTNFARLLPEIPTVV